MDEYLIDREILSQFVDVLMKRRSLPVSSAEEIAEFKESQIRALDDKIIHAIFDQLNVEQANELNYLLDKNDSTAQTFKDFFAKFGISIKDIITKTMIDFGKNFLGGNNA